MKIVHLSVIMLLTILSSVCSCYSSHSLNNNSNSESSIRKDDSLMVIERSKLKKYAFCRCIMDKYSNDSFLLQDGSLEGLVETGLYGNHAYAEIDSFVKCESRIKYGSKYKKNLFIMQCLDIYQNKKLDSLIYKLDDENSVFNKK